MFRCLRASQVCFLIALLLSSSALPIAAQDRSLTRAQRVRLAEEWDRSYALQREKEKRNDLNGAVEAWTRILAISRQLFGDHDELTGNSHIGLGIACHRVGQVKEARAHFERSLAIARRSRGEENTATADAYERLADVLREQSEYVAARAHFERALAVRSKLLGERHEDTAQSHENLGVILHDLGDNAGAVAHGKQALETYQQIHGEKHERTAGPHMNLGIACRSLGDYAAAREHFDKALAIYKETLGERDLRVANLYTNIALLLENTADYAGARKFYDRAIAVYLATQGRDFNTTAIAYNNLGILLYNLSDYAGARSALEEALSIRLKILGERHDHTASTRMTLALLHLRVGEYDYARQQFEQALSVYRQVLGEDHLLTASACTNLGLVHLDSGNLAAARIALERALAIKQKVLPPNHRDFTNTLTNLGSLFDDLGDYRSAVAYHERALEIRRKTVGEKHLETATSYVLLSQLHKRYDDPATARTYAEKSLEIRRELLGEENADTAASCIVLGGAIQASGDAAAALPWLEKSLAVLQKVEGEGSTYTAAAHNNLAHLLAELGRFPEARQHLERALAGCRKVGGDRHASTLTALNNLVSAEADLGDWQAAARWMDQQRRGTRNQVALMLPHLSEREQLAFLEGNDSKAFTGALTLGYLRREDPAIVRLAAEWLLNGKGVAQQALGARASLARETRDPKLAPLVKSLGDVRRQLARSGLTATVPGQEVQQRQRLADLTAQEGQLARQLAEAGGAAEAGDPWIELDAVRKAIPADAVLVDIARFSIAPLGKQGAERTTWGEPRYVAWVVPPAGRGDVQLVDLGEAAAIESSIVQARTAIEDAANPNGVLATEGEPAAEVELRSKLAPLSERLWKPLAKAVGSSTHLLLSPDAALWLVPWAALPIDEDKYLVEKLAITYLIAGRELTNAPGAEQVKTTAPVVFANPNFDCPPADVTAAGKAVLRAAYRPETAETATNERSLLPHVTALPGTAIEAAAIKPGLEAVAGQQATVYGQQYALESVAKELHRPRVAVFATHGFFLPDQEVKREAQATSFAGNESRGMTLTTDNRPVENPLLRCGLLLAGCNPRNAGQPGGGDDGVLTGLEVAGIDLRGTELVVLSACETGLGQVRNGEGVSGLRQAFQLAGAQAVVATLWQIPDKDTAQLMTDFFGNLAANQSKADALRNSQLALIKTRRERHGAAHPFYWAAFTVTGLNAALAPATVQ